MNTRIFAVLALQHAVLMAVLAVFFQQHLRAETVPGLKRRHHTNHRGIGVLAFGVSQPSTHHGKAALRAEPDLVHTASDAEGFSRETSTHARQDSAPPARTPCDGKTPGGSRKAKSPSGTRNLTTCFLGHRQKLDSAGGVRAKWIRGTVQDMSKR